MNPDSDCRAGPGEQTATRIAIVMTGRKVSPHFGQAEEIMLVEVEQGNIIARELVDVPSRECGVLPDLLKKRGISDLVTGFIGARALRRLLDAHVRVYSGASGSVEDVLGSLLSGHLTTHEAVCEKEFGDCVERGDSGVEKREPGERGDRR